MSDFLARSLKRLYDDCVRAIEEERSESVGKAVIDRYNELLEELKQEHPENERIQALNRVSMSGAGITLKSGQRPHPNDLQEIKFGLTTIADSIGLDLNDFQNIPEFDEFPVIEIHQTVDQTQTQQQTSVQSVTFEQLYEDIDRRMGPQKENEELRELVERFEDELENEDADEGLVRDLIESAKDFSSQLAMKMAMLALERGIDILV